MPKKKPVLLGLTGSIGMGKTTTAAMFADAGAAVWDADAAVHRLYARGGAAVDPVKILCPEALINGAIDRSRLRAWIAESPGNLRQLEATVHPLVAADRQKFISEAKSSVLLFDIPLLFETGADDWLDSVVVVTTDAETQRERVLKRGAMGAEDFERVLANQMPDSEKRRRADFVILTETLEAAREEVESIMATLMGERLA